MAITQSSPLIRQVSHQAQCDAKADTLKSNLATARRGIAGLLCLTQHKNRPAWLVWGVLTQYMWRFVANGHECSQQSDAKRHTVYLLAERCYRRRLRDTASTSQHSIRSCHRISAQVGCSAAFVMPSTYRYCM